MDEKLINKVEELLSDERGNSDELRHILNLLKQGKPLPRYDRVYLDLLIAVPTPGYRGSTKYKSEGTSLVLSLFFGMFGIMGVGHRYVGNVRRSIAILYSGWILLMVPMLFIFAIFVASYGQTSVYTGGSISGPMTNFYNIMSPYEAGLFLLIPAGLVLGYFVLYIWQIFDARNQTRKFNEFMDKKGTMYFEVTTGQKIAYAFALILPILTFMAMSALSLLIGVYLNGHHSSSSFYPQN